MSGCASVLSCLLVTASKRSSGCEVWCSKLCGHSRHCPVSAFSSHPSERFRGFAVGCWALERGIDRVLDSSRSIITGGEKSTTSPVSCRDEGAKPVRLATGFRWIGVLWLLRLEAGWSLGPFTVLRTVASVSDGRGAGVCGEENGAKVAAVRVASTIAARSASGAPTWPCCWPARLGGRRPSGDGIACIALSFCKCAGHCLPDSSADVIRFPCVPPDTTRPPLARRRTS